VPVSLYAILLAAITLTALAFSGKVGDRKPQPKTPVVHESSV
jgi:hypothetical protein